MINRGNRHRVERSALPIERSRVQDIDNLAEEVVPDEVAEGEETRFDYFDSNMNQINQVSMFREKGGIK